jgi:hypothetical protein
MLKGQLNDGGVENFNFLNSIFVDRAEVIMPVGLVNIKDVIVEVLDALQALIESLLKFF